MSIYVFSTDFGGRSIISCSHSYATKKGEAKVRGELILTLGEKGTKGSKTPIIEILNLNVPKLRTSFTKQDMNAFPT